MSEKNYFIKFFRQKLMKKENWKLMLSRVKKDITDLKWAIIAVIAYFVLSEMFWGSVCPMACITGLPCPSCGLTRAGLAVLHLDFAKAWDMHPFIFLIGIWTLSAAYERYFQGRYKISFRLKTAGSIIIVGMILFYVYRMYVYFPDNQPMVYNYDNVLYYIWTIVKQ